MNQNTSFSLSLQKRLERRKLNIDSEISTSFKVLGIRTLLHHCNIRKQKAMGKLFFFIYSFEEEKKIDLLDQTGIWYRKESTDKLIENERETFRKSMIRHKK